MTVIHPSKQHLPQLKSIWAICFGDSAAYVDHFFEKMFSPDHILIACNGDQILGMMMLLPAICRQHGMTQTGRYVYAVATLPEYRGQGVMKQLHAEALLLAKQDKLDFFTLVPASPSLFAMYQTLGYQTCSAFVSQVDEVSQDRTQAAITTISDLPPKNFLEQRRAYLASMHASILLLDPAPAYRYEQITQFGGVILALENQFGSGYLVGYVAGDALTEQKQLVVRETNLSPLAFEAAGTALGMHFGVSTLLRHLSAELGAPHAVPYGMMRPISDAPTHFPPCSPLYMNLMLD